MGIGALSDLLGGGGGGGADTGLPPAIKRVIEIDGSELEEDVNNQLERVVVVDRLRMPDSCELVFRDPARNVLERAGAEIGAKIKVSTSEPGADSPGDLFFGEITSIEVEYDVLGMRAVVRGYDLLHRLAAGRKTKTFENVTYSDVAEEIAGEAGLDIDMDSSGGTVDHVLQNNVSDLDFLYQLARRVGFDLGIEEETLQFKKPTKSSEAPDPGDSESTKATQLVWGRNLHEFRARMSAVSQVTEVKVRGWDVKTKEAVIGQADAETSSAEISMAPADLADAVGGETLVIVDRPVADQGAADDLAKAIAEQVGSAAYEATAVAVGSPLLKAGEAVSIAKVDAALSGDWVITTARHEFGNGPYRTHLEFTGRQDRSIHGLVAPEPASRMRIPGIVIGIVTDNADPEKLGRVKVRYPWLSDDAESWWARLAALGAGKREDGTGHGVVWVPEVGEEVVVAFEHGDIAFPIVVGSLWNGVDKPPMMGGLFDSGAVKKVALISRKGHGLIFHDTDENTGIVMGTADGKQFLGMDEKGGTITLSADGKTLTIETTGDLILKADGAVKIEAGTTMDLKATSTATLKGAKVAIN